MLDVSSKADGGQFHHENVMPTAFIFLLGALAGSSEADRGESHQEKVISTASTFL